MICLLDTPCAAGARSDGLRPHCQQLISHIADPKQRASGWRQFEENLPRGAVPGRIWRNIVFVHILQKELQTGAGKGSLNRLIPGVNFFESGSLLDP